MYYTSNTRAQSEANRASSLTHAWKCVTHDAADSRRHDLGGASPLSLLCASTSQDARRRRHGEGGVSKVGAFDPPEWGDAAAIDAA